MSLFRSTVETYAPEFAKAEATKAQTNAIAELKKYENSTVEGVSKLAKEALIDIRNGKNADGTDMTANQITEKLNNTLNDINAIIERKELEELKAEKIAEFSEYLNYTEIDEETIKNQIAALASQAINEIGKCENKKDVNTKVEEYLAKIDEELQNGESSSQQRIEKTRQEALAKIAEYEELATKTNEISLISAIIPYENKINSANATVQSINDTLATVIEMIKANYDYIDAKIKAIETIEGLTALKQEDQNYDENIVNHKDVKEIKDAIEAAIENIKNAPKPTDIKEISDIRDKNITEIKKIAENVNTMEEARKNAITEIQKGDLTDKTTGENDDEIANGSAADLVNNYINEVKAVTLAQYNKYENENEDTNIFDDIVKRAKADIETFIKNIVKSTVNFDYQLKGISNVDSQTGYFGQLVSMPKNPEVSDSTLKFKGWYDSSDETKTIITGEIKFTDENKTYNALWEGEITSSEGVQSAENINSAIKDLQEKLDLNEGDSTTIKVDTSADDAKTFSIESAIEIPAQVVLEFTDDVTLSKSSSSTTLSAKGGVIKFDSNVTIADDITLKADENGTINFGGNVIVSDKGTLDVTSDTMKKENNNVTITKQVATEEENNKLQTSLNNEIFDVVQLNAESELVETSAVTIDSESNATLDLNGKKLKSRSNSSAIVNEGNLTITDSTVSSVNTRAEGSNAQIQATVGNAIENKGKLTIEGGTFDAVADNTSALVNAESAIVTLNGGTFTRSAENGAEATSYYTVVNNGDMTIKDGAKLYNKKAYSSLIKNGYYTSTLAAQSKTTSKLTIEGGTFNGGKYVVKNDYNGELKVTGGDYTAVNGTKCIFKTIGKMELDLIDPENTETKNNLKFNVTNDSSIEAIVLVGDQKVAGSDLKDGQNTLEVYGFDFTSLITGDMNSKKEINVEKDSSNIKFCQSNIIVHIYDQSILHTLIKDYINADLNGTTIDENNNINQIVLETDVDLTELEDEISDWKSTTNERAIIIDLNNHNIKCTSEYKLNNTGNITIIDSVGGGRITVDGNNLKEEDYPKTLDVD